MLSTSDRIEHDVVFAGAGHANMLALRMLAMSPPPQTCLTLVSPQSEAAYSGMVPGYLAGRYARKDICINLPAFCAKLGIRFVQGHITGLDSKAKQILMENQPAIGYDILSLNLGAAGASTPEGNNLICAKPVHNFMNKIEYLIEKIDNHIESKIDVVGGGAAGVEIAMALKERGGVHAEVSLFHRSGILKELGQRAAKHAEAALRRAGINIISAQWQAQRPDRITIMAAGYHPQNILVDQELQNKFPIRSDLKLQGHDDIFVVGDMAYFKPSPLPKSGVYAVRSAPILAANIRASLLGGQSKPFRPQKDFLRLVSLGTKNALASKYGVTVSAPIIWKWKHHVDQSFMRRFHDIPIMTNNKAQPDHQILCTGCAGKISGGVLQHVFGSDFAPEDAMKLGKRSVASIDGMRSFLSDEYVMASIATRHALGDILVSGAKPEHILISLALPAANDQILARRLKRSLTAVQIEAKKYGASISGGHSLEAQDWLISLAIIGRSSPQPIPKQIPDGPVSIIQTDPVGVGAMMAAHMQGHLDAVQYDELMRHLLRPLPDINKLQKSFSILAATDLTGFGVAGHLLEMFQYQAKDFSWANIALPHLPGAEDIARIFPSSLLQANQAYGALLPAHPKDQSLLRFDPQTCGGFLIATRPKNAPALLAKLGNMGHHHAKIIAQRA
tara:strand:- start:843 stop:2864 length:2022 start_codon:yes stop_codon:yes gene_type:complete